MSSTVIGFVGLGNMGGAIARSIARAGHRMVLYDKRDAAYADFPGKDFSVAASLDDVGQVADIVGVCVLDDQQVIDVTIGSGGLVDHLRPGTVIVIFSTVTPQTVAVVAAAATARQISVVDAPVTGPDLTTREGTLSIMVGGAAEDVERCRPILDAAGRHVFHMGPLGAGAVTKLCNNLLSVTMVLAILECFQLAEAYGIDEAPLLEMLQTGGADSWQVRNWGWLERMFSEHTLAGTPDMYRLFTKDLWNAVDAARAQGIDLPMAGVGALVGKVQLAHRESKVLGAGIEER